MTDETTKFEDAESYSPNFMKDKITFRDIILQHVRQISKVASVEFRGGYWQTNGYGQEPNGTPFEIKIYVPDSREIYSNSIACLADMLYPYFDAKMSKAEGEIEKQLAEISGDKTEQRDKGNKVQKKGAERLSKGTEEYRGARVKIQRKLFRELCSFLYRKKYLELGTIED